ncbi:MAG: serine/threonine protein kinase, partial [Planctomycetes bacterium]|nr:serine/threonine protein kinase [Planctomycetota bacterium]
AGVYKAVHQTMNRVVALKVLSPQLVNTERARELFAREVQAAAQLSHPNIVMAFDANEYEGRHYLAMEYVDGPNLERYVKEHGALPIGLACEIIFQAANGLQHAHEKGMVHRDIKPANLLIHQDADGRAIQVKILDFGVARFQSETAGPKTIVARENTVMGTPDFLSPEQSKNLHEVDIRSDLYSLGCTFSYLLTGQVPFPGGAAVDKVIRHNTEAPVAVDERRPGIPPEVAKIVGKLLAKNPADRFQTPDELLDALAPHAAPGAMEWPVAPSASSSGRVSQDEIALGDDPQVDTDPRAQATTHISDEESIHEWVDQTRQERQRTRRILGAALALAGLLAVGVGAYLAWTLLP